MVNSNSIKKNMSFAIKNIIRYGDTDIFPYPIERQIFVDKYEKIVELLEKIYGDFEKFFPKCQ